MTLVRAGTDTASPLRTLALWGKCAAAWRVGEPARARADRARGRRPAPAIDRRREITMLCTATGTSHVMMMVMDDDDVVMVVMIVGESGHGRERNRGQQDCSEEFL
jgi:hypothetical protein